MSGAGKELTLFFLFVFFGMAGMICYDTLRILRGLFSFFQKGISLQDFFYWIGIGFYFSYLVYSYHEGSIRAYLIIGFALGMILVDLSISRLVVPRIIHLLSIPLNFGKKVLRKLVKIVTIKRRQKRKKKEVGRGAKRKRTGKNTKTSSEAKSRKNKRSQSKT